MAGCLSDKVLSFDFLVFLILKKKKERQNSQQVQTVSKTIQTVIYLRG